MDKQKQIWQSLYNNNILNYTFHSNWSDNGQSDTALLTARWFWRSYRCPPYTSFRHDLNREFHLTSWPSAVGNVQRRSFWWRTWRSPNSTASRQSRRETTTSCYSRGTIWPFDQYENVQFQQGGQIKCHAAFKSWFNRTTARVLEQSLQYNAVTRRLPPATIQITGISAQFAQ